MFLLGRSVQALTHALSPLLADLDAHTIGGLVCGVTGREDLILGETHNWYSFHLDGDPIIGAEKLNSVQEVSSYRAIDASADAVQEVLLKSGVEVVCLSAGENHGVENVEVRVHEKIAVGLDREEKLVERIN